VRVCACARVSGMTGTCLLCGFDLGANAEGNKRTGSDSQRTCALKAYPCLHGLPPTHPFHEADTCYLKDWSCLEKCSTCRVVGHRVGTMVLSSGRFVMDGRTGNIPRRRGAPPRQLARGGNWRLGEGAQCPPRPATLLNPTFWHGVRPGTPPRVAHQEVFVLSNVLRGGFVARKYDGYGTSTGPLPHTGPSQHSFPPQSPAALHCERATHVPPKTETRYEFKMAKDRLATDSSGK